VLADDLLPHPMQMNKKSEMQVAAAIRASLPEFVKENKLVHVKRLDIPVVLAPFLRTASVTSPV
jgi:hypothetical protein